MPAQLLDGKKVAAKLQQALADQIAALPPGAVSPCLAIVQVGDNSSSLTYVRNKIKACQKVGIKAIHQHLPENIRAEELAAVLQQLAKDETVHGILLQLPLPGHLQPQVFFDLIPPQKDVDGLHSQNLGRLMQKQALLRPCTAHGIVRLLNHYHIELSGKRVVILNASSLVGRPLAMELLTAGATVTVCNSKTRDLASYLRQAEIVISGTGHAHIVDSQTLSPGVIAVDVGVYRQTDGSLVGDFDFATASQIAAWITPVPGGIGPMTIAILLENLWQAHQFAALPKRS